MRLRPVTGNESIRDEKAFLPGELHSTDDQKRLFLTDPQAAASGGDDYYVGPVYHGAVSSRLTIHATEERGCWPGDSCVDSSVFYLCLTGNGTLSGDWRPIFESGDISDLIDAVNDLETFVGTLPSQEEAEAGTATTPRVWSAERVWQAAIAANQELDGGEF